VVAAGHTSATDLTSVDGVTHVFNAMAPFHHRDPGPAGIALADDRLFVTLIADGHHVDPVVVRLVARAAGERLVLVSDGVAEPTLPLNGGRVLLDQCVRNLASWTGDRDGAIRAATVAPARVARLERHEDDLVTLDDDLRVVETITRGQLAFRRD
jgi:N-acetylglucosamine-6-phosphate deacetylase